MTANNLYFNRELSWLRFNDRVLEEGENTRNPLLEQLRFLSIAGSNLDEFYMIRMGDVVDQVREGDSEPSPDGFTATEELERLRLAMEWQMARQQTLWRRLKGVLKKAAIYVVSPETLGGTVETWLNDEVARRFPQLKAFTIGEQSDLPFIPNKGLVVGFECARGDGGEPELFILPLPADCGRFIALPEKRRKTAGGRPSTQFVTVEAAVAHFAGRYLPGREIIGRTCFRVLRDSDLDFDERTEDALLPIEKQVASALKRRPQGAFIRLEAEPDVPGNLLDIMLRKLAIETRHLYTETGFLGIADLSQIIVKNRPDLQFKPYEGRFPERIRDYNDDCFAAIRAKDIVVHHPYETFDAVLDFLRQAADDPAVEVIKWTLYRTSRTDHRLVETLKDASRSA